MPGGAFLGEIWRGSIQAIPRPQWEAAECLSLTLAAQLWYVILPQAARISIPPTVGFAVQLIKSTSIAAIIGFVELTRAGQLMTNATFQADDRVSDRGGALFHPLLAAFAAGPDPRKAHRCHSWH
jgi:ABC-type amino acid transport system permease subunit